ncbi:MAG: substrate-binding domain-containing protein [Clostridiaceae bacterium]|nr:substrate-binding domain-containing protein [Clostridiaceae bacterium]
MKTYALKSICCVSLVIAVGFCSAACIPRSETTGSTTGAPTSTAKPSTTTTEMAPTTTKSETTPVPTTSTSIPLDELPASFPLLDSSTARIPITAALYDLFVRQYGLQGPKPICSKTHQAWLNLADGTVDLILCIAPTAEEKAYLYEKGVDVEMRLYGCDGLVFLGNSANPVKNLTKEQIKGIYRGDIVNWSEFGGPDHKINAYYREDQSGSQRFFEDLVWKGEDIPDFASLDLQMSDEMSDITYTVIEDPYAIGFNIMSYVDMEFNDPKLMLFSIEGVAPKTEALADASYAYITQAYVIINADEPADSPARWLFNWFGCDTSRELIAGSSSLSVIFGDPILLKTSEK